MRQLGWCLVIALLAVAAPASGNAPAPGISDRDLGPVKLVIREFELTRSKMSTCKRELRKLKLRGRGHLWQCRVDWERSPVSYVGRTLPPQVWRGMDEGCSVVLRFEPAASQPPVAGWNYMPNEPLGLTLMTTTATLEVYGANWTPEHPGRGAKLSARQAKRCVSAMVGLGVHAWVLQPDI